jgi:hypothetical protein
MTADLKCPKCGSAMPALVTSPSLIAWCGHCGGLLAGRDFRRPAWLLALDDSSGECLRDDRALCGVYRLAVRSIGGG